MAPKSGAIFLNMITIIKNQANKVILTLKEKQTIENPDFLFEFVNDTEGVNDKKLFTATDISLYSERYNEFVITDSTTELPYQGQMNFSPVGYWSYTIYEMAQGSPNDLDPDNALGILETGKVEVIDQSPSTDKHFEENDDPDNVCFDEP